MKLCQLPGNKADGNTLLRTPRHLLSVLPAFKLSELYTSKAVSTLDAVKSRSLKEYHKNNTLSKYSSDNNNNNSNNDNNNNSNNNNVF